MSPASRDKRIDKNSEAYMFADGIAFVCFYDAEYFQHKQLVALMILHSVRSVTTDVFRRTHCQKFNATKPTKYST